jgi:hypothetical protein
MYCRVFINGYCAAVRLFVYLDQLMQATGQVLNHNRHIEKPHRETSEVSRKTYVNLCSIVV